jgi:hypothetical protein
MNEIITQPDQFEEWRRALASGKPVAYERGQPRAGYYRLRARNFDRSIRWDALAIWRDEDSLEWYATRTGPYPAPTGADAIEELFVNANSTPISYELFESIMAGGAWPDAVAPVETAPELPPHEAAAAELKAQQDAIKAWLAELGHKPQTQEEADRAANWATAFAAIESKAEKLRKAEKAPFLEQADVVDAKWVPTREAAKIAKAWAKKLSDDFAIAETARRKREADAENARLAAEYAAAKAAEDARLANEERLRARGAHVPEFAPPPKVEPPKAVVAEPVKLGTTGKRQSLVKTTTYEIIDAGALLRWLADRNIKSEALLAAALADAKTLLAGGFEVPGVKTGVVEQLR